MTRSYLMFNNIQNEIDLNNDLPGEMMTYHQGKYICYIYSEIFITKANICYIYSEIFITKANISVIFTVKHLLL